MGIANQEKTINKIKKYLENTQGFKNFKPKWVLEFSDGSTAKVPLEQKNASEICAKIQEGGSYLFTIEDGVYEGKAWWGVRDVISQVNTKQTQKQTTKIDTTIPLNGPQVGMILNNACLMTCARINAGQNKGTEEEIKKDMDFFCEYFENKSRQGTFIF